MKKKIYENFYNELTRNSNENIDDILNNSKDTKITKFKKIYEKRNKKIKKKKNEIINKQSCREYYDLEIYDNKIILKFKKIPKEKYDKEKLAFNIVDFCNSNKTNMNIKHKDKIFKINDKQDIIKFFKNISIKSL